MGNFFSKGTDYFALFEKGIEISNRAAQVLQTLFADGEVDGGKMELLREIEHEGDRHVHACASIIEEAFVTPIDRNDLMRIVAAIEAITDSLDEIGNQVYMMHITKKNEAIGQFVELIAQACAKLCELMTEFRQFKKTQEKIHVLSVSVNHIEEQGDDIFTKAVRTLFDPASQQDAVEVIRMQNLYNAFENSLDYCEDVADIVEQVIISNT
jgi:uncharacterized protein